MLVYPAIILSVIALGLLLLVFGGFPNKAGILDRSSPKATTIARIAGLSLLLAGISMKFFIEYYIAVISLIVAVVLLIVSILINIIDSKSSL